MTEDMLSHLLTQIRDGVTDLKADLREVSTKTDKNGSEIRVLTERLANSEKVSQLAMKSATEPLRREVSELTKVDKELREELDALAVEVGKMKMAMVKVLAAMTGAGLVGGSASAAIMKILGVDG